jgi:hypothetical protein
MIFIISFNERNNKKEYNSDFAMLVTERRCQVGGISGSWSGGPGSNLGYPD